MYGESGENEYNEVNRTGLIQTKTRNAAVVHKRTTMVYASSYASMVAVLAVVIPSVRLSVTRVHCDKTKQYTADILISHKRAITLVF